MAQTGYISCGGCGNVYTPTEVEGMKDHCCDCGGDHPFTELCPERQRLQDYGQQLMEVAATGDFSNVCATLELLAPVFEEEGGDEEVGEVGGEEDVQAES